jgi:hypothetical protein
VDKETEAQAGPQASADTGIETESSAAPSSHEPANDEASFFEPVAPTNTNADGETCASPADAPGPSPAPEAEPPIDPSDATATTGPSSAGVLLGLIRPAAVLALLATLFGRGFGPSLVGSFPGSDQYEWVPVLTTVLSHATSLLLALVVLAATLSLRFAASSLAGMVLGLGIPAAVLPLPSSLGRVLAIATTALTLVAAARGVRIVPTRALSLVAGMLAIGAIFRQIAWTLAVYAGEHALVGAAVASRWIASAGMLIHAIATASALVWLATRRRRLFSPWTTVAMITAVIGTRYAELGQRATSSFTYFIGRAATELARPIHPIGPTSLRVFLVLLSALFALVAVCQRKQVPAILGAFALLLLGGVDADVPIASLFTAAGALVIVLVSEDKRTLWAALEVDTLSARGR